MKQFSSGSSVSSQHSSYRDSCSPPSRSPGVRRTAWIVRPHRLGHRHRARMVRARLGSGGAVRRRQNLPSARSHWRNRRPSDARRLACHGGGARGGCASLLSCLAYVLATYQTADRDGTTEAAALLVLATGGSSAGSASAALGVELRPWAVLALAEKNLIRGLIARIGETELRAALRFAVLALVVLPLLPVGPLGPYDAIRPRALWRSSCCFPASASSSAISHDGPLVPSEAMALRASWVAWCHRQP